MALLFDSIASQFDDQRALPPAAVRAWLECVDRIAGGSNLQIVEPGIGTGRVALPLAMAGHTVRGVDISAAMLDHCRQRAVELRCSDRLDVSVGDACDLPYADHDFELGVIAQLLYLVNDWPTVLDELARVVRPGGTVIYLTEPTVEGDDLAQWSTTWRTMIEATGFRHQALTPTDADVASEFLRRWPDTHVQELARWQFGQTVRAARQGFSDRLRPLYPTISGADWDASVARFLRWSTTAFADDAMLGGEVVLTARIAAV